MMRPLPVVDHLSYSQAATANRCPRAWWLRYDAGVLTPASPAMEHGKAVDELVTRWLGGEGYTYLTDPEDVVRDAVALWDVAKTWDVVGTQVRHEGHITGVTVPVIGYSDALLADGTVVDWKVSRQWRDDWKTQLSLYHLIPGPFETNGRDCRVARVYNGKVSVYDFEADIPAAEQFVRDAWETLSAERHPLTPGQHCSWCSVSEECAVLAALEATV